MAIVECGHELYDVTASEGRYSVISAGTDVRAMRSVSRETRAG